MIGLTVMSLRLSVKWEKTTFSQPPPIVALPLALEDPTYFDSLADRSVPRKPRPVGGELHSATSRGDCAHHTSLRSPLWKQFLFHNLADDMFDGDMCFLDAGGRIRGHDKG